MKRTLLTLALMLSILSVSTTITAFAQKQPVKPCSLTLDQSPEVRGLKLGQSYESRPRFAGSGDYLDRVDEAGVQTLYLRDPGRSERFQGTDRVRLLYLDGVLVSFTIDHKPGVKWQSDAHFTAAIADTLHLPSTGWTTDVAYLSLPCDGFVVRAGRATLGGMLEIETTGFVPEIRRRQEVIEQKKRAEFKP